MLLCQAQTGSPQPFAYTDDMSIEREVSKEQFEDSVKLWRRNWRCGVHYVFGVFDNGNAKHIGRASLLLLNRQLRWANIGYQVHAQYSDRGYATEAAKLVLEFGFRCAEFHRIESAVNPANSAAASVARKIGMELEGTRRNFFPGKPGSHVTVFAANELDFERDA